MRSAADETAAEAWVRWFQTTRAGRCGAYLCATYGLARAGTEALINMAAFQVVVHWATLQTPLTYFRTTVRRAVQQHLSARATEHRCIAGRRGEWLMPV